MSKRKKRDILPGDIVVISVSSLVRGGFVEKKYVNFVLSVPNRQSSTFFVIDQYGKFIYLGNDVYNDDDNKSRKVQVIRYE